MIRREIAQAILTEIAGRNGIEGGLVLDENGHCAVGPDGEAAFHLAFDESDGSIVLAGLVGPIAEDEEAASRAMRFLLASNLYWHETGGATLALETSSGFAVLQQRLTIPPDALEDIRNAGAGFMENELLVFVDLLGFWQKRYAAFLQEDAEEEDDSGHFDPAAPFVMPVFDLRV